MTVCVQTEPFVPGAELDAFTAAVPGAGAVVSFTGLVRDFLGATKADGTPVTAMTLEHYPGMTERELARIAEEAGNRWPLDGVLVIHRYGRLEPNEPIVFVATASAHRRDAFAAAEFLMDWLKTKAPFWKCEETPEGETWVAAKDSDEAAAARWETDR